MSADAPLALWAACRAFAVDGAEPRTVEQLAGWLAPRAVDELAAPASDDPRAPESSASQAFLAAQSLGIAGLAERLARDFDVDPPTAQLLGLVHAARRWLDEAAGESVRGEEVARLLPPWLRDELEQIELPAAAGEHTAAACVARAIALVENGPLAVKLPADCPIDRQAYASQLALARVAWLRPPACGQPRILAQRLQRLAELSDEFDRTLEREKLDALKELAYGAGHEINNPLANISARARRC